MHFSKFRVRLLSAVVFSAAAIPGLAMAQEASPGSASSAGAFPGFYFRGDMGAAILPSHSLTDPGLGTGETNRSTAFIGDVGIGYRFTPVFRTDLTFSYLPSSFSGTAGGSAVGNASVDSYVGMANGYIDLNGLMPNTFGRFQPYLSGSLGFSHNHMGDQVAVPGGNTTSFAWGLGAGVGIPAGNNMMVDIAYKYLDLGQMQGGIGPAIGPVKGDLTANTITVGLRVPF